MTTLQIIWFGLLAFLFVGYTVLDGFDLGVGIRHLFLRDERERKRNLNSIAPFWDGNEVWLITAGGALFAAFPPVYASVLSSLYLPLMLLLLALVARAVSIEFRAGEATPRVRGLWDLLFGASSLLAVLLFGTALGNILRGLPLDSAGNSTGTVLGLFNPFALLVGLLNVLMLATHGGLYAQVRADEETAHPIRRWTLYAWMAYLIVALITLTTAIVTQRHLLANYLAAPALWIIPALAVLAIIMAGIMNILGAPRRAFAASALAIILLLGSAAAALFPTLVPALGQPAWSLTAANASSSPLTLKAMLIITLIGMPFILGYTYWVYRVFGGKVTEEGYY
ncbi:MAG: cytochrome d ubiquinol oxidase subunit II [Armatimonadota bacterium]